MRIFLESNLIKIELIFIVFITTFIPPVVQAQYFNNEKTIKQSIKFNENVNIDTIYVGTRKQLFIDDFIIENTTNITKVLNQGNKVLSPVLTGGLPWEKSVSIYGSVIKDGGVFKMWYKSVTNGDSSCICYATSTDGLNWEKPSLGLFSYYGNYNNNIIKKNFEICSIIKNSDTISYKKYILYGYNSLSHSYQTYWSSDGISNFQLIATHLYYGDVCYMIYDSLQEKYIVTYKIPSGGNYVYKREFYNSTTTDFINFTNGVKMESLADSIDLQTNHASLRVDCYGLGILPYEGVYIGFDWLFYISNFNQGGGSHIGKIDVQLVFSRDITKQWQRTERQAIIPLGENNSWDDGLVVTASTPIIENNEVWMYYGGFDDLHKTTRTGNIGLVKWRLDGFMSLNNNNDSVEGIIETKLLIFEGNNLTINANSSKSNAYILVELLDENGDVIQGYSKNDCTPIIADDIRKVVTWGNNSDISFLSNNALKIKIYSMNSEVYALQFINNEVTKVPIISGKSSKENFVNIFTNSDNSILFIKGLVGKSIISIYNVEGELISINKTFSDTYFINIDKFLQGIYIINIENYGSIITKKFVK